MLQLADPRRVARQRVDALVCQAPLARAGEVEAVHEARVASRRLREFLPLLVPASGREADVRPLRRQARAVTRALGPVRELDVSLLTLARLTGHEPADAGAAAHVRRALEAARSDALTGLDAVLAPGALDDLRHGVVGAASPFGGRAARRTCVVSLARRLAARTAAAATALDATGALYAADRLHRARIALKQWRYALELAESCAGYRLRGTIRRLKGVQDILGDLHDNEVLAGRIRDLASGLADRRVRDALAALIRRLDEGVRHRHAEFLVARPSLVTVLLWARRVGAGLESIR